MKQLRGWLAAGLVAVVAHGASAQDTTNAIRLGVRGASSAQPGLAVLSGPGLDSARAIVRRDLENSNRFTMPPHASESEGVLGGPFDPNAFKGSGLTWIVLLQPAIGGVDIKVYDVATGTISQQATRAADLTGVGDGRMSLHRISDQVVTWVTGGPGMAATRIAFLMSGKDGGIWRIDSDGANLSRISHAGAIEATPAWSPDGSAVAYSEYRDGLWGLYIQRLGSSAMAKVPASSVGNSFGGNFSPDGKMMVFTHGLEKGSDIESVDISRMCCAQQLTHNGRFADNVSPTYSPDGRRVAYVSLATGTPEIWVMDNDGTGARQMVASEFDTGSAVLSTFSPAWSPDGTKIMFARDTHAGGRQLYTLSVGSGQVAQVTSSGRNEDPSWAPDSRHVVFKSGRSGRDQLWVLDVESGALRQLATPSGVRYPAWSHSLGTNP